MPVDETKYFFSYARDDSDFVLKLAKELRAVGANLWLDQLDIVGGQRWDRAVEEALATCQSMIVVLSPESVASNNVMDEVSYALEENKLVIPVLHKDCSIPFRLRRVQRIDFTADYDTGFADLLRALGIEQPEGKTAVGEEIDELLASTTTTTTPPAPEPTTTTTTPEPTTTTTPEPTTTTTAKPAPTSTVPKPTRQEQVKGALILAGTAAGLGLKEWVKGPLVEAISGIDRKRMLAVCRRSQFRHENNFFQPVIGP